MGQRSIGSESGGLALAHANIYQRGAVYGTHLLLTPSSAMQVEIAGSVYTMGSSRS